MWEPEDGRQEIGRWKKLFWEPEDGERDTGETGKLSVINGMASVIRLGGRSGDRGKKLLDEYTAMLSIELEMLPTGESSPSAGGSSSLSRAGVPSPLP